MHCFGVFQALLFIKQFRKCTEGLFIMLDEGANLVQCIRGRVAFGKQVLREWVLKMEPHELQVAQSRYVPLLTFLFNF